MPKYEEIANVLRERIKNQTYPTNSLLPNQIELVTEFAASRATIKKAITILTMEGLVYSRRGAGTKVLNHAFWDKQTSAVNEYHGLSKDLATTSLRSQVIEFEVQFPDQLLQEKLSIAAEHPVYKIIRLRLVDDQPFVLEHTYMPCDLVPGLNLTILQDSIYTYLEHVLNIQFAGAYRYIQAAQADTYDQEYLACLPTDPVLEVQQVIYLENGRPIEYSRSRNRYDVRGYSLLDVKK